MTWEFEQTPPMGGATGEAFSNVLMGTGMVPASVLAREAIQNSVDASIGDASAKVRVVFRRVSIAGEDKRRFVKILDLANSFLPRKDALGLQVGNVLDHINDLSTPIDLLFIEDYGTHGLYGQPHAPDSHFYRLLLSLGEGSKARDQAHSGGSYGYGKAVYSASSRIHTLIAYSVFDPARASDSDYARLFGCGYFKSHEFGGENYTGRAWFADPDRKERDRQFPFSNDAAHRVAKDLGFTLRDCEEMGTSVLIVDCSVDVTDLRSSIEDWWWPRIVEDALDIEIWDNGTPVPPPRPRKREDLRPYLHCFEMAVGRSVPMGSHDRSEAFNRYQGVPLGRFGFTLIDDNDVERDLDEGQIPLNSIALIRSPLMVVRYEEVSKLPLPAVGVFVAAEQVDLPLKLSEPPAHDRWDPTSLRLVDDRQRAIVKTIHNRLLRTFRRFSRDAVPEPVPGEVRLDILERMLGSIFRPPASPGRGGGYPADPIKIHFHTDPVFVPDSDGLRTEGSFSVAIAEDAEKDDVRVAIKVSCLPIEDDRAVTDDPISVDLVPEDHNDTVFQAVHAGKVIVCLRKGDGMRFAFRSEPYPEDWTTSVSVQVEEVL